MVVATIDLVQAWGAGLQVSAAVILFHSYQIIQAWINVFDSVPLSMITCIKKRKLYNDNEIEKQKVSG